MLLTLYNARGVQIVTPLDEYYRLDIFYIWAILYSAIRWHRSTGRASGNPIAFYKINVLDELSEILQLRSVGLRSMFMRYLVVPS